MPRPAVMLRQVARLTPFERSIPSDLQVSAALVWNSNGWLELSYGLLALAPPGLSTLVLPSPLEDGPQQGTPSKMGSGQPPASRPFWPCRIRAVIGKSIFPQMAIGRSTASRGIEVASSRSR